MEKENPAAIYASRATQFEGDAERAKEKVKLLTWLRLMAFVGALAGPYWLYDYSGKMAFASGLVFFSVFLWLVRLHQRQNRHLSYLKALVAVNQEEQKVLKGDYTHNSTGEAYWEANHHFAHDLDLFGDGSLFQYLDRTASLLGATRLAHRLKTPWQTPDKIKSQQVAVRELAASLDFRQEFLARGRLAQEKPDDHQQLVDWCADDREVAAGAIYAGLLVLVPVAALICLVAVIAGWLPEISIFYFILFPLGITGLHVRTINRMYLRTHNMMALLQKYATLLSLIEKQTFESKDLSNLQALLKADAAPAGATIKALSDYLSSLDNRNNFIGAILLNGFLLWDIRYTRKVQAWRKVHGKHLLQWLDVLWELDALSSLANYAYNRQDAIYPKIEALRTPIEAHGLGHPLLITNQRVDNDFSLDYRGKFVILTGANMAGKSTFLRTVGVNLILGMMGAPIIAQSASLAPVALFSSMRTTDSLQDNASYFYAELSRLQQMLSVVGQGFPVFIILDEILKGTNSKDKEQGSKKLVRKLVELGGGGIVATHDLALCQLATELPGKIENACFEVDITNDGLQFDYKMRPGVCQNMNASYLMKEMGLID
ncbi:MAG: hypothetical protein ACFB10_04015 [Salibacteraceae bacterium]